MATPETGNVAKTEAIVANLVGREITVSDPDDLALLLRIVGAFAAHWQPEFDELVADPDNSTNNELTGFFLFKMKEFGKAILRSEAETGAKVVAAPDITQAGDDAEVDLD